MFYRLKQKIKMRLSDIDLSVKRNYKLMRRLKNVSGIALLPLSLKYEMWDNEVIQGSKRIPVRFFCDSDYVKNDNANAFSDGIIVFFHGGGWTLGGIDSYTSLCVNLMRFLGCRILSVDYRLAPEHKFPAGLLDCYAVVKKVFETAAGIGINPEKIVTMGDSAGGNLSAALNLMLRDNDGYCASKQILLYPSTASDHGINSPFRSLHEFAHGKILTAAQINDYIDLYKSNDDDLKNPYFSPLSADDYSNQPDTLIITAEFDPLRDEGEEYGKRLSENGAEVIIHRVKNACHGFFYTPPKDAPEVRKCYDIISDFLKNGAGDS